MTPNTNALLVALLLLLSCWKATVTTSHALSAASAPLQMNGRAE